MPSRSRSTARANSIHNYIPSLNLANLFPSRTSPRPKKAFSMTDRSSFARSERTPSRGDRQPRPLSSLPLLPNLGTFPSFGSRAAPRRSNSVRPDMEALITMFGRPFNPSRQSSMSEEAGTVSMSHAGQKVIPATFNLVPIEQPSPSQNSNEHTPQHPTKAFDQAGGHQGSFHIDGGTLIKKVTNREATFYEDAQRGLWPTALLPKYYGRASNDTIKIENLTHGFNRPCVIDLKMGVQTVEDDETSILKKLKMTALDHLTRSRSAGCRLEGLSMYRTLENRRIKGTKSQSHSISAHVGVSLQDVLTFFLTDEHGVRTDLALRFQLAVEQILTAFEKNDQYRFIGSSILLIYDNDNRAPYMHWARALRKLHTIAPHVHLSEDQISGLTRRTRCDVRMIDFAHTGPLPSNMQRDEGYITGLRTILKALKAIRVYRSKPIFSLHNAVVDLMEETRASTLAGGSITTPSSDGDAADTNNSTTDASDITSPDTMRGDFTFDTVLSELTAMSGTASASDASVAPTISSSDLDDVEDKPPS